MCWELVITLSPTEKETYSWTRVKLGVHTNKKTRFFKYFLSWYNTLRMYFNKGCLEISSFKETWIMWTAWYFFIETTSWKCFEQYIEDVSKYFEEVRIRQTRCSYRRFRQTYILRLLVISGEVRVIFYWNYPLNDLTVSFRKQALGSYNRKFTCFTSKMFLSILNITVCLVDPCDLSLF